MKTQKNQNETPSAKPAAESVQVENSFGVLPSAAGALPPPPLNIQAKMQVGSPDDPLEREADKTGDQVVSFLQRMGPVAPPEEKNTTTAPAPFMQTIQRQVSFGALSGGEEASSQVAEQIQSARGSGQPLPPPLQAPLQFAFGADLSGVRVHTDQRADDMNQSLGARAFTTGQDIFFRQGEYQPETTEGQRLLGHELGHVGQQGGGRTTTIQRTLDSSLTNRIVETIHDGPLLDAVRLMREHNQDIGAINGRFQGVYQTSIQDYIIGRSGPFSYDSDLRIKAWALLHDDNYNTDPTKLAIALLLPATDEDGFWSIMNRLNGRQERNRVRTRYNQVFRRLGSGSLESDIDGDFDGVDYYKALILAYRNLTSADWVYLCTAGQAGTNEAETIAIIRREWRRGVDHFEGFLNSWNTARNPTLPGGADSGASLSSWFDPDELGEFSNPQRIRESLTWNARALIFTVLSELSGAESQNAKTIFLEFFRHKEASLNGQSQQEASTEGQGQQEASEPASYTPQERSDLRVATSNLRAACGVADTNEEELYAALRSIGRIYRGRIDRLERAGASEANIRQAREDWRREESRLVREIIVRQTDEGYEHQRARMELAGMDDADRLYLNREDPERVLEIIEGAFRAGRINQVLEVSRRQKISQNNTEIRPAFNVTDLVSNSGFSQGNYERFIRLIVGGSDREKGASRLRYEIQQGAGDSAMEHLNSFLLEDGWRAGLLDGVLRTYMGPSPPGAQLTDKVEFVMRLRQSQFSEAHRGFSRMRDAFDPANTSQERHTRALNDRAAERAPMGVIGDSVVAASDALTGGRTLERIDESERRLAVLAGRAGATPQEREYIRQHGGSERQSEMEYEHFQSTLQELRQTRTTIAQFAETAASLALNGALTALTGGTTAPFLGSAIAQAIAISVASNMSGMVLREIIDSRGNDLFSTDNLQRLIVEGAGAGAGALVAEGARFGPAVERMTQSAMGQAALREGFSQSVQQATSLLAQRLRGQRIDAAQLQEAVVAILTGAAAAGISNEQIREQLRLRYPSLQGLHDEFLEEIIQGTVQNAGQETAAIAREGDIDNAFGRLAGSIGSAWRDALISHGGRRAGESARQARETRRSASPQRGNEPGPDPVHVEPPSSRTESPTPAASTGNSSQSSVVATPSDPVDPTNLHEAYTGGEYGPLPNRDPFSHLLDEEFRRYDSSQTTRSRGTDEVPARTDIPAPAVAPVAEDTTPAPNVTNAPTPSESNTPNGSEEGPDTPAPAIIDAPVASETITPEDTQRGASDGANRNLEGGSQVRSLLPDFSHLLSGLPQTREDIQWIEGELSRNDVDANRREVFLALHRDIRGELERHSREWTPDSDMAEIDEQLRNRVWREGDGSENELEPDTFPLPDEEADTTDPFEEPGSVFDPRRQEDPRRHEATSPGVYGEVMTEAYLAGLGFENLGTMTDFEDPERGPGIDALWRLPGGRRYRYAVSESKSIANFDGTNPDRYLTNTRRSGRQESDLWITGNIGNTPVSRLEKIVGADTARDIRAAINETPCGVLRLLVIVDRTGHTWTYEVDGAGHVIGPFEGLE